METLRLNFDTEIDGTLRQFTVEVPYRDGVVATSRYCPARLLSDTVNLMAAIHGETLDKFMDDCRRQLLAMSRITDADTTLDRHIGALMAVVMDHLSRDKAIAYGDLLIYMDCFSLLLKADGFTDDEIHRIYPQVTGTITNLYPDHIKPQTT